MPSTPAKYAPYSDWLIQFIENELPSYQLPLLIQWIKENQPAFEELLQTPEIQKVIDKQTDKQTVSQKLSQHMISRLLTDIKSNSEQPRKIWKNQWLKIAASVVLVIGVGSTVWLLPKKSDKIVAQTAEPVSDIKPGSNMAYLQLGNGQTILLDSAVNGQLARQGNTAIIKKNDHVIYSPLNAGSDELTGINTLSTPHGGQYKLQLPDGSLVWLNAASSISFPAAFHKDHRKVSITGEVYFEIKKDQTKPFIVDIANGASVEVLGTSFNIQSYNNEKTIQTTLLEGSVKIRKYQLQAMLQPGQQAQISKGETTPIKIKKDVDTEQVMAWKNGFFSFANSDLESIMRQIARWYDVEIVYKGTIPKRSFGGEISRNTNLSQVLKILEESSINFTIDKKTIIVQP
ncbi:FecR family protein [Flavihumibacter sp. UBA7668]|uniref:FecR family protein n=1 Tax=Flavihumibacter sp. UBA7668 TaxID=1946542 RepID=UPI0025C5BB83|nr:FecR family protein [Flavihumibacter sp. UBA7668]